MMWQSVQSCELGGTSREGVQLTVDNLDGSGGLMANKNKVFHLRAMAMCLWVPYHRWVAHGGGAGKVPLVRKLNYLKKFSRKSSGI
jgi:hypothetical protein